MGVGVQTRGWVRKHNALEASIDLQYHLLYNGSGGQEMLLGHYFYPVRTYPRVCTLTPLWGRPLR